MVNSPHEAYRSSPIRFPFTPELLRDETISSWMDRLAASHRLTRYEVIRSVCVQFVIPVPDINCDWDADPDPRVISALEVGSNLKPGTLMRNRLPRTPVTLALRNRDAFCPLCAASELKRGQLPSFRRTWALAIVTHCHVHSTPLYSWPESLQGNDRDRRYDPIDRARVCAAWPKGSDSRIRKPSSMAPQMSHLRAYIQDARRAVKQIEQFPSIGITWRQQVALEQDFLGLISGRALGGPLSVLGRGLPVLHAIRDLYALLVEKLGPEEFWPRLPYMEAGLFPDHCFLWTRKGHIQRDFFRLKPNFYQVLTEQNAVPQVRRAGLYILHQWLLQMIEMCRANCSRLSGPYRECHVAIALSRLQQEQKDAYRDLMALWPSQMRHFCRLPLELEPVDDYEFRPRKPPPRYEDYNPLWDAAPSILSLVPLPHKAGGKRYRLRREDTRWPPAQTADREQTLRRRRIDLNSDQDGRRDRAEGEE